MNLAAEIDIKRHKCWGEEKKRRDSTNFRNGQLMNVSCSYLSPPVIEEPKEPVDPAVRAKENWLRLYNKVLDQLREVRSQLALWFEALVLLCTTVPIKFLSFWYV